MRSNLRFKQYKYKTDKVSYSERKTDVVMALGQVYGVLYRRMEKIDRDYVEIRATGLRPEVKRSIYL